MFGPVATSHFKQGLNVAYDFGDFAFALLLCLGLALKFDELVILHKGRLLKQRVRAAG